jgi:hypothetical protein
MRGFSMRKIILGSALGAAVAALICAAPASAAAYASVMSDNSTPTFVTAITAGTTYHITATGSSNLLNGSALNFDANGTPLGPIGAPYAACYPAGCAADPTSGNYGVGGALAKLGALLGAFTATPGGAADYFTLGADYTFTALTSGSLYAVVNDVNAYGDNQAGIGFKVFSEVVGGETGPIGGAVPEPATWALMIAGFGMVGASLRRRTVRAVAA